MDEPTQKHRPAQSTGRIYMFSRFVGRLRKRVCSNLDGNRLANERREAFAQLVMHCSRSDCAGGATEPVSGSPEPCKTGGADAVETIEPDMDAVASEPPVVPGPKLALIVGDVSAL